MAHVAGLEAGAIGAAIACPRVRTEHHAVMGWPGTRQQIGNVGAAATEAVTVVAAAQSHMTVG